MTPRAYDAIVVGAGAGGAIAAAVLTEAGRHVLLLDRGRALAYRDIPNDHLRNHRLALYGFNTEPHGSGHPRVVVGADGVPQVLPPHASAYGTNPTTLGGGTRVYGMQAWRFHPTDFQMATRYGVPEGSSLADWPIGYDDLAPSYERAEWEIGVAGDVFRNPHAGVRARGYPLPPVPGSPQRAWLARGAASLGWETFTPPLLLNSVPRQNRPACVGCGECIGFACHVDAKNGTHNTALPRALATGLCELVPHAHATSIETDARGRAVGVTFVVAHASGRRERRTATAPTIILAAGAIETARLLLLSTSRHHPQGLGNTHDHVGRHLQGHYYTGAYGFMPPDVSSDGRGPGVNIATTRFNHGNPGVIGGGLIANEFIKTPLLFWRGSLPPGAPRWGAENKRLMRDGYLRHVHLQSAVQEIPSPDARVTLDPTVRDTFGLPVARLSGTTHPATLDVAHFMRGKCEEWLRAAGAEAVWSWPRHLELSAGQHQAGTCRMSADPREGVTDPTGRVHGHDNLFIADSAPHVTNGGFNPVLTIMALAYRTAEAAVRGA